jgi:hypothetical protein
VKQKTAIITIVIALVLAVTTALYIVRATEDRVTADFVARVDRFAIPADWKQESEIVRPERFLCMSPNPCPASPSAGMQAKRPPWMNSSQ